MESQSTVVDPSRRRRSSRLGKLFEAKPPILEMQPTQTEWNRLVRLASDDTVTEEEENPKSSDSYTGVLIMIHNFLLLRSIRRDLLRRATEQMDRFSKSVGGGALVQKFRQSEKVITFRVLHVLLTLVVWQHFFFNKYEQKQRGVPDNAPNYYWKTLVPPIEFGLMHAILFQLSLVPITVSRSVLAWISSKTSILPLEHIMTLHIHIGYAFCTIMLGSAALFFTFFGKLCQDYKNGYEPVNMCEKFEVEIMATGYVILSLTLIIFLTAYYRGRMSFEAFFAAHVFATGFMYVGAIVHTMDDEFRKGSKVGKARSQTFRWLIGSLAIFLGDRVWRYFTQGSRVPVLDAIYHADGGAVTIKLIKPWWFTFTPGQYLHMQIPAIDAVWHPFSIGSDPESIGLTVIIEVVQKPGEWTNQLSRLVQSGELLDVDINIRGPFGNPVGPPSRSSAAANIVAVGSGTGIVPMLSLLKARAALLAQLSGDGLQTTAATLAQRQNEANLAYSFGHHLSPGINERVRHFQLKYRAKVLSRYEDARDRGENPVMPVFLQQSMNEVKPKSLWIPVMQLLWLCLEVVTTSLMLSWSNLQLPAKPTDAMITILEVLCSLLVLPYAIMVVRWIILTPKIHLSASLMLHVLAIFGMGGTALMLVLYDEFQKGLSPVEQTALFAWSALRIGAMWVNKSSQQSDAIGVDPMETFKFMWVTRSAELTIGVLRDLDRTLCLLELSLYGSERRVVGTSAFPHLQIAIWCSDKREERVKTLKKFITGSRFEGLVQFGRPDFNHEMASILRTQILSPTFMNRLSGEKKSCAVTFAGSQVVSNVLAKSIRQCGQLAAAAGAKDFKFTYRTESYSNMPPSRRQIRKERKQSKQNVWDTMHSALTKSPSVASQSPSPTKEKYVQDDGPGGKRSSVPYWSDLGTTLKISTAGNAGSSSEPAQVKENVV